MEHAVRLERVAKRYGDNAALAGVSLRIAPGTVHGLIGPDGAGKTTLLRVASGVLRPDAGTVRVAGRTPADPEYPSSIGYMPQAYGLYLDLSLWQNLVFFSRLHGLAARDMERRGQELLELVRLAQFRQRLAGQLSGGMYKKLALCTVLVHEPDVLLLDEPTNGVDPVSRRDLWDLIFSLAARGKTIFISTPYMDEAARCHSVTVLDHGRVLWEGKPADLALGGSRLVSLRCRGTANPMTILADVPGVEEAYPVEDLFTLRLAPRAPEKKVKDAARARLSAAGLEGIEFVERDMKFDDVFFQLTSGGGNP